MLVVDASVAFKWVVQEPDSALARGLIGADRLGGPELVLAEVANALWAAARRGEISPAQATRGVADLPTLFDQLFPLAPLMAAAFSIARELDHPVYDCVYLALCESGAATLVTADGRFLRRIAGTSRAAYVRDLASFGTTP